MKRTVQRLGAALLSAGMALPLFGAGATAGAAPPPTLSGLTTFSNWSGTMDPVDVCDRAGTSLLAYDSAQLYAWGAYTATGTESTTLTFGPQTGPSTSFGGDLFPTGAILAFDRTFSVTTDDGIVITGTISAPQAGSRAACGPGTNYPILDGTYFQYVASYTASITTPEGMYSDSGTVTGVLRRIISDGSVRMNGGTNTFTSAQTATTPVVTPPIAPTSPCSLEQDRSEAPGAIQLLHEQGNTSVTLCSPLAVDIATPGLYARPPIGTGNLAPGTVASGTAVRSFLVHADRAYAVTKNGDYLYRPNNTDPNDWVTLRFTGGEVLGIIVRDAQLDASDTLGASGTAYPIGLQYRGHEVNLRVGKTYLNDRDIVYFEDRQTVKLRLQVGELMDQVRIITDAGAVLDTPSLKYVRVEPPPPSLAPDAYNTERCGAAVPSIKTCNKADPNVLDDVVVLFEQYVQPVKFASTVPVDIGPGDGVYTRADWPWSGASIAVDTPVYTHMFHADRPGDFDSFADGDFAYYPSVTSMSYTFSTDILGVIVTDARLDRTDVAGRSGYEYPTGWPARGADYSLPSATNASDERIEIRGRTVHIRFQVGNGIDQVRVITAAP